MYQKFAYVMRSGRPILGSNGCDVFWNLAMQLIKRGDYGKMTALQAGRYTTVPIEIVLTGKKQVDVEAYYDKENYKPMIKDFLGVPMFLT